MQFDVFNVSVEAKKLGTKKKILKLKSSAQRKGDSKD